MKNTKTKKKNAIAFESTYAHKTLRVLALGYAINPPSCPQVSTVDPQYAALTAKHK